MGVDLFVVYDEMAHFAGVSEGFQYVHRRPEFVPYQKPGRGLFVVVTQDGRDRSEP